MLKAAWLDDPDIHTCLCCGQTVTQSKSMTQEDCARALRMFEAMGVTRGDLLGKHRAKIDYQAPGFAAWLQS